MWNWHIYVILETGKELAARVRGTEDEAWDLLDMLKHMNGETYVVEKA